MGVKNENDHKEMRTRLKRRIRMSMILVIKGEGGLFIIFVHYLRQ